jgi:hypothetical protein
MMLSNCTSASAKPSERAGSANIPCIIGWILSQKRPEKACYRSGVWHNRAAIVLNPCDH